MWLRDPSWSLWSVSSESNFLIQIVIENIWNKNQNSIADFFQNFLIDCILKNSNMESRLAPKSIQKVRLRSGFQFWIVCDFLIINWSAVNFSLSKIREYECQYIRIIFYNSFQVTIRFKTENWLRYVSSDLNL